MKEADRSSEECDARSERQQEHLTRVEDEQINNCCADETTRRRGTRYRHKPAEDKDTNSRQEGILQNVMREDQKGCKKNNVLAEEEQITAARTKQHGDKEEYTGRRPAERKKKEGRKKHGKNSEKARQQMSMLPLSRSPR